MRLLLIIAVTFLSLSFTDRSVPSYNSVKNIWIESRISSMTLDQKISQSFIVLLDLNWETDRIEEVKSFVRINAPGGVFVRGGSVEKVKKVIKELNNQSTVPLFVATEASFGLNESFFVKRHVPFPLTVASADSLDLTERMGEIVANECKDVGINLNFVRCADVFSNPLNSSGFMRSFGENPRKVSNHSKAFFTGHQKNNVAYVPLGFPGEGDLDRSDDETMICRNARTHIDAIDLMPFRTLIQEGVGMIGMSNALYPELDQNETRATASKAIIGGILREQMGFSGIVISGSLEDLKMKTSLKAYLAGCDMLLKTVNTSSVLSKIKNEVEAEEITLQEIEDKCRRILSYKYDNIVKAEDNIMHEYNVEWTSKSIYEKAMVAVKNDGVLPIQRFDQRIALVSIGSHVDPLWSSISRTANIDCYHAYSAKEAISRYSELVSTYDIVLTSVHTNNSSSKNSHLKGLKDWSMELESKASVLLINGGVKGIKNIDELQFNAVLLSLENHPYALDRIGELVMGCVGTQSTLSVTLSENWKRGHGVILPWAGRLSMSHPSVLGISNSKLHEIDNIVNNGINSKAFPGCQVLVAVDGKVLYRKSFGHQTYDTILPVKDNTIYDVASVTKVVSSTASVMRLQSQGQFSLDSTLGNYLSIVDSTSYKNMVIREMMAHQAGLYPWIPFYIQTMSKGVHDSTIYSSHATDRFSKRVSTNLWIDPSYERIMYDKILETSLGAKSYKYSDLGYYFLKRIIEDKSGLSQDKFVSEVFYQPMGLQTIGYNPLDRFPLSRIPPTEDDKVFRKELVHGYVHDQGTAMLGGVGGHAGIFSNSWDLAAMMQMFLNGGKYGTEFISEDVVDKFTECQFCPGNRRGAGFDKPVLSLNGGPTCNLVSLDSFGHSGFTGTFVWADPKYKINYVFLSNRVYPDAENWKIVSMGIRSEIQRIIYEAVLQGSSSH